MNDQTTIRSTKNETETNALCYVTTIANYFIDQSKESNIVLTNLSMQKLVYFAYGWTLAKTGKTLFYDRIEAWPLGPVIPSLYHQLKQLGENRITQKLMEYDHKNDDFFIWNLIKGTELYNLMGDVWNKYKPMSARKLVELTHNPGTPWYETVREHGYKSEINDNLIRVHFAELMTKKENENG